jgi:hypothetical protein
MKGRTKQMFGIRNRRPRTSNTENPDSYPPQLQGLAAVLRPRACHTS